MNKVNKKKTQTVTIYDVAKEADVSLATVSRVLNNTAVVRPERRKRVEDAIKKLNFVPNEIARGLARKSSTTIGIIVEDMSRASVSEIIDGIIDTANLESYDYSILLNTFQGEDDIFKKEVGHMISSQIDGLLVMGDELTEGMHEVLDSISVPVVVFSTPHDYENLATVAINYRKVVDDVVAHYKGHHDKITMIARDSSKTLHQYFTNSCEKAGVEGEIIIVTKDYQKFYQQLTHQFKTDGLPKAVFTTSDTIALATSNAIQDLGHSIPEDTEIISFSNTQNAMLGRPQITSVSYPIYRIGAYAMSAITKLIKEGEMPPIHLEDDFEIVWRGSTK